MRAYEFLKETTVYNDDEGDTIHIEDRGPNYRLEGHKVRYYGWADKYDISWNTKKEMKAWIEKNKFYVVGWEKIKEKKAGIEVKQKLPQKKGMTYYPDKIFTTSKITGEPFDWFEVKEALNGKSGTIFGVRSDGYKEEISTTRLSIARTIAGAYNKRHKNTTPNSMIEEENIPPEISNLIKKDPTNKRNIVANYIHNFWKMDDLEAKQMADDFYSKISGGDKDEEDEEKLRAAAKARSGTMGGHHPTDMGGSHPTDMGGSRPEGMG